MFFLIKAYSLGLTICLADKLILLDCLPKPDTFLSGNRFYVLYNNNYIHKLTTFAFEEIN
tara:strand:+ start:177 stop:356 length:180 start_codon:yes stop_codon:yes gene_type:complete